jgi:hypothetical protein
MTLTRCIGFNEVGWDGQARFSIRLLTHGLSKPIERTSISPAALDELARLFSKEMDHESWYTHYQHRLGAWILLRCHLLCML